MTVRAVLFATPKAAASLPTFQVESPSPYWPTAKPYAEEYDPPSEASVA